MQNSHLYRLVLTFLFLSCTSLVFAQDQPKDNTRQEALNVFLDCGFCDVDYIRKNVGYVNYVRDTKEAQVHILATSQRTGSGGREYTFNFIGQLEFAGQNDTLSIVTQNDATADERRELRTRGLQVGLMPYVVQTPMVEYMKVEYAAKEDSAGSEEPVDKWNFWVFRIGANGWFNGEERYKSKRVNGSFSANRITEKWKIENWGDFGYNQNRFTIDSATTITNFNQNFYVESSAIRAINDHWSAGLIMSINSSTFRNIRFNYRTSPALEYNIFKYSDFTRKQIRLQYRVGFDDFHYVDTTIYNKKREGLFNHKLSVAAEFVQKWGSFSFSSSASHYFHDPSLNRLTFWGSVSWRIFKGLSFNASGSLDYIRDQISLPKGGASPVEILTQQRLLATQYSYWGFLGVSYTFGSIYNNVVNPRFGN